LILIALLAKVAITVSLMMESGFIDGGGGELWRKCLTLISYCHLCGECFNELVEFSIWLSIQIFFCARHVKEGKVKQENRVVLSQGNVTFGGNIR